MSIQHLFTSNNYNLNCGTLTANALAIPNLDIQDIHVNNDLYVEHDITAEGQTWTTSLFVDDVAEIQELKLGECNSYLSFYERVVGEHLPIDTQFSCSDVLTFVGIGVINYLPVTLERIGYTLNLSWSNDWSFIVTDPDAQFVCGPIPNNIFTPIANVEPTYIINGFVTPNGGGGNSAILSLYLNNGYIYIELQNRNNYTNADTITIYPTSITISC